jgi:hypothetical protein
MNRIIGISIGSLSIIIGIIMCALKMSGMALSSWSWVAVTAFVWGPPVLFVIITSSIAAFVILGVLVEVLNRR